MKVTIFVTIILFMGALSLSATKEIDNQSYTQQKEREIEAILHGAHCGESVTSELVSLELAYLLHDQSALRETTPEERAERGFKKIESGKQIVEGAQELMQEISQHSLHGYAYAADAIFTVREARHHVMDKRFTYDAVKDIYATLRPAVANIDMREREDDERAKKDFRAAPSLWSSWRHSPNHFHDKLERLGFLLLADGTQAATLKSEDERVIFDKHKQDILGRWHDFWIKSIEMSRTGFGPTTAETKKELYDQWAVVKKYNHALAGQ